MNNITESNSNYDSLENKSIRELLTAMNREDQQVPLAVGKVIPQIEYLVEQTYQRMKSGGRLFYIGAGTSGRLGVLDASELPPTFGVEAYWVTGLIAGGDDALRKAVEGAEDDTEQAWQDLLAQGITKGDALIGIAASGTTPYVIEGVKTAREQGCLTGCITCNQGSPLSMTAEIPIEVLVGPEFVTGSTRMKAGTAQKLVLNMISTSLMIRLGRVKGNKMVNMQLTNQKLVRRGTRMLMDKLNISEEEAREQLLANGSVKKVLDKLNK